MDYEQLKRQMLAEDAASGEVRAERRVQPSRQSSSASTLVLNAGLILFIVTVVGYFAFPAGSTLNSGKPQSKGPGWWAEWFVEANKGSTKKTDGKYGPFDFGSQRQMPRLPSTPVKLPTRFN